MKQFNPKLLKPVGAALRSRIFENSYLGIPPKLIHEIFIDLAPFELENETHATSVQLGFINFPNTRSINDLANKTFTFPINPEDGYIDGSLYLFHVHNPFDVTQLVFGPLKGGSIPVAITYNIEFEFEGTGYENIRDCQLNTVLSLTNLTIDPDILEGSEKNLNTANKLISQFTDVNDYLGPKIEDETFVFDYKITS